MENQPKQDKPEDKIIPIVHKFYSANDHCDLEWVKLDQATEFEKLVSYTRLLERQAKVMREELQRIASVVCLAQGGATAALTEYDRLETGL